ncbi:hypothetical protein TorRG33x02_357400, partial [Trema orientale]
ISTVHPDNPSPPWTTPPILAISLPSPLYLDLGVQWSPYDKANFEFNDGRTPPTTRHHPRWPVASSGVGVQLASNDSCFGSPRLEI